MSFQKILEKITEKYDPKHYPSSVKPVVVASGEPYDAGFQIGEQIKEDLASHAMHLASHILEVRKEDDVLADIEKYNEILKAQSPQLLEMWRGTADGSGLPFEAMHVINIPNLMTPPKHGCSTISTWGSATASGKLLCAVNADGGAFTPTSFSPTMALFLKSGKACLTNGGYASNMAMNISGMVTMASNGGWNGHPDDIGYGTPAVTSTALLSTLADNTEEALDIVKKMAPIGSAENLHISDINGNACIVEETNRKMVARRSGDHGEKDYILATNHFISEEFADSKPADLRRSMNSMSRYRSEEQLIKENHGKITLDILNSIISCRDYFDGEWHKDIWDEELATYTPEKRTFWNDTYMQCLVDPENRTAYFRQGQSCSTCSPIPGATGKFSKITLKNDPKATVFDTMISTKKMFFAFAQAVETGKNALDDLHRKNLEESKRLIWEGENYRALAAVSPADQNRTMYNLHKAISCFVKAQALLQF